MYVRLRNVVLGSIMKSSSSTSMKRAFRPSSVVWKRKMDDEDEDYFNRPQGDDVGASWLMDALKVEEDKSASKGKGTGTIDTSFFTKLRQEGRGRRMTRSEERAFFRKVMEYSRKKSEGDN
jgi:hypothetical protein